MQLHLLSQTTGFGPVCSEKVLPFGFSVLLMLVVLSPSLLQSVSTAGLWTYTSEERQRPCFILLPAQEHKTRWWGKGSPFHCANPKPPIELPVSKHSPPLSSSHAIYPMHTKNTNPSTPISFWAQAGRYYVGGASSMQSLWFLCWPHHVSPVTNHTIFSTLCLQAGVREEVLLSSPYPPENTALMQCHTIKAIQWLCCASPAITAARHHHLTTYSWKISSSRMRNGAPPSGKEGSSNTHHASSHCQSVLL